MSAKGNLELKLRVSGEKQLRIAKAARIKIDGSGLTLMNEQGDMEKIVLDNIAVCSIQSRPRISAASVVVQ